MGVGLSVGWNGARRRAARGVLGTAAATLLLMAFGTSSALAAPVTIAGPGFGAGKVLLPVSAAVHQASGDLYTAEENGVLELKAGGHRVDKFDSEGEFQLAWGLGVADGTSAGLQTCGPQTEHPRCFAGIESNDIYSVQPAAVAVDQASGDVYAVDRRKRRVTKFTSSGEFLFAVGKDVNKVKVDEGAPQAERNICTAAEVEEGEEEGLAPGEVCGRGESGTGAGEFFGSPISAAVDASGHLWVGDTGRVIQFDSDGNYVSQAEIPGGGAVKGLGIDPLSGDFYVKAASLSGVRRYKPEGSPVSELTEVTGAGLPLDDAGQPDALVVDSAGNVYIGDKTSPYRFLRFNPSAQQTSQFGAEQVLGSPGASGGNPLALDEGAGFLYSVSSQSAENSFVQRFDLPPNGPLVESQGAEDLEPTKATLAATLNPEGHATEYHFEYGTDESYGEETATETLPGSGFDAEGVEAEIGGLTPGTTYHFHLLASNECEPATTCTAEGPDATFATPPAVAIDAQWASGVAARSASLHAQLDPLGVEAEWWIEFGTSAAYGSETVKALLPAGFGDVEVGALLSGLAPGATYHYRFAAADEREGAPYIVHGPDRTFATQSAGLGFSLADDRAWEMVTPVNKHAGVLRSASEGQFQAAAGGDAFTFLTLNSMLADPEGSRSPERSSLLSRREAGGAWRTTDLSVPNAEYQTLLGSSEYKLFGSDLSRAVLEPRTTAPLSGEASERAPYLRANADPPAYTPLVTGKEGFANVAPGTEFGQRPGTSPLSAVKVIGGDTDLSHVLLNSCVGLKEDEGGVRDAQGSLYEWTAGQPPAGQLRRVSVLPGEEVAVAGVPGFGKNSGPIRNALAGGGSRVFWTTDVTGTGCGTGSPGLYLRDLERGESVRLDTVQGGFGTGGEAPRFQGANAAGTVAFFTDTQNLTSDANESGADLYRCDVAVEEGELKCVLTDLTADAASFAESAEVQGLAAAVSDDGQSVYFVARGVLDEGANGEGETAASGQPNLYLWKDGEGIRFIAGLAEQDESDWGGSADPRLYRLTAAASPSARYLAFMSQRSLTGYDNRDAATGEAVQEVFLYDAAGGGLLCASCNPAGARPASLGGGAPFSDPHSIWSGRRLAAALPESSLDDVNASNVTFRQPRAVHDSGRLFFNAADSLVPADANGNWDVYEYEPVGTGSCAASSGDGGTARSGGGCVSLISSGTGGEEAAFFDASESGDDAFFATPAPLSASDEDQVMDVYDARVGGVAASATPRAECLGEACQPAASAPAARTPASAAFRGPGNLVEGRNCGAAGRRAARLSHRAKRLRRHARMARRNGKGVAARKRGRKARRLAHRARKQSGKAKRCRRANRRARR